MSTTTLPSFAEMRAKEAESLEAFHGLNLLHIRRQVTQLLSLIGRDGIFDQYTVHDITHIDKMLASLDWIVPDSTKSIMSPADWLMTVLAIYFHDLGMLVTPQEFDNRLRSDFPRYRDEILFAAPDGFDYQQKIKKLSPDRVERFLYQEFVRNKHAERVRLWVTGQATEILGVTHELFTEINKLLEPLGDQFRRDLGLVCESHHLNDLNNRRKYKTAEPYGDSQFATANVQYCAVLLRTVDLLHITSDRTPSITFKVINPTDPISQDEWAKQRAVKRVQAKYGLNDEGQPDEKAPRDTIQVHAYFKNEDGFFGLTTYLSYCSEQLKQSNQWIVNANKEEASKHEFPWRKIDDANIQTEGFIRDTFEFAIDQAKILDLLTGHTLYNDTRVVLRELVQNALDAIRIQNYPASSIGKGKVNIRWNSKTRMLSVTDNGTGMTQKVISDFLLKVGSSRYQDPEFKKQYPDFSSISRFGIGVLSAFMIADSVDILTCHPEDDQARQLTLRSVHGKYLIRLLDKRTERVKDVFPHGTSFELRLRPSVRIDDVLQVAKMWIMIPGCDVFVTIDEKEPTRIGHASPAHAVVAALNEAGTRAEIADISAPLEDPTKSAIRVVEKELGGVRLAYAVQWSPYFREWTFLPSERTRRNHGLPTLFGTCIEGIRVEFQTPGYVTPAIAAIANVTGVNAPKTNVARSGIEATQERDEMLRNIYRIYRDHIASEVEELRTSRSYSLTWAIEEARYLTASLLNNPTSKTLLEEELAQLEVLAVERGTERLAISPKTLAEAEDFWTIECTLLHPAEALVREAKTSASLSQLVHALSLRDFQFPEGLILCGVRPSSTFGQYAFQNREVEQIVVNREQRRIDLRWREKNSPPRWLSIPQPLPDSLQRLVSDRERETIPITSIFVGNEGVEVSEEVGAALITLDSIYLMPSTPAANYLRPFLECVAAEPENSEAKTLAAFNLMIIQKCLRYTGKVPDAEQLVMRDLNNWIDYLGSSFRLSAMPHLEELIKLVADISWSTFSPAKWTRKWYDNAFQ